jgi:hypothetical protein
MWPKHVSCSVDGDLGAAGVCGLSFALGTLWMPITHPGELSNRPVHLGPMLVEFPPREIRALPIGVYWGPGANQLLQRHRKLTVGQ